MEKQLKNRVEMFAQKLAESNPSLNTATLQESIVDFARSLTEESKTVERLTSSLDLKVRSLLDQTDSNYLTTKGVVSDINSMRENIKNISNKFEETEKNIETLNTELKATSSKFTDSLDDFKNKLNDELRKKVQSAQGKPSSFLDRFRR